MKKYLSMLLALVMVLTSVSVFAEAETTTPPDYSALKKDVHIIEATDTQVELGYVDGTTILDVDGLKFKDLNKNGSLDVYEDWRKPLDERIEDLYNQMTVEERAAMFYHVNTCGDPSGPDFTDERLLWEMDCPFDAPPPNEDGTMGFDIGKFSMKYYIDVYGITHYLDNANGIPEQQVAVHNAMQQMGEETRLGMPITISNDRQYNAWGGMIDTPHDAFGTAADAELGAKLWEQYSLESRAVGIHVVLHPYGQEIGSWNGEDPEYAGTMAKAEIEAIQVEGGTYACAKHFIARGGDSDFHSARSDAQTVDNWMTAWKLALEANPKWLMTNGYNTGLSNTVHVDYDKETMDYLRKTLGYDGVILSDWGAQGDSNSSGVTADGIDLLSLTMAERYAFTINLGLDQIGSPAAGYVLANPGMADLNAVKDAINQGLITEERVKETVVRLLATKFELGLFENPYSDAAEVLAMAASAEYIANPWEITDTETLMAARNPEIVELERQLQAKSAVLIKNDGNLLPLSKEYKLYITSTASEGTLAKIKEAFAAHTTVVETIEEADAVLVDATNINDAVELTIDDAKYANKKLIVVTNNVDPNAYVVANADAVLFFNFSRTADHGTSAGASFIATTEPCVYAEIIYGVREPEGMIVKEIARDSMMDGTQWKDLAGDQGASTWVRLMLLATMKTSENNTTPHNWGDPLLCYKYGMRYGQDPVFVYDTLVLPRVDKEVTTDNGSSVTTSIQSVVEARAGVPFKINVLLWNEGAAGMTTVQVKDGDTVIAEKIMALNANDWRVVEMEITINTPGEHTLTVGDLVKTISIAE